MGFEKGVRDGVWSAHEKNLVDIGAKIDDANAAMGTIEAGQREDMEEQLSNARKILLVSNVLWGTAILCWIGVLYRCAK